MVDGKESSELKASNEIFNSPKILQVCKALANRDRLTFLFSLSEGPKNWVYFERQLGMNPYTVSRSVEKLSDSKLIRRKASFEFELTAFGKEVLAFFVRRCSV